MVIRTEKTEFKEKKLSYDAGHIVDEDGEVVDLYGLIHAIFGEGTQFDLSASVSTKDNLENSDFTGDVDVAEDAAEDVTSEEPADRDLTDDDFGDL